MFYETFHVAVGRLILFIMTHFILLEYMTILVDRVYVHYVHLLEVSSLALNFITVVPRSITLSLIFFYCGADLCLIQTVSCLLNPWFSRVTLIYIGTYCSFKAFPFPFISFSGYVILLYHGW